MYELFAGKDLHDHLVDRARGAEAAVSTVPASEIRASESLVVQDLLEEWSLTLLTIDDSKPETEFFETSIERRNSITGRRLTVPAMGVLALVPFAGAPDLLRCRPSRSLSGTPVGEVRVDQIAVSVVGEDLTADQARAAIRQQLNLIKEGADIVNAEVKAAHPGLEQGIRLTVSARAKLLAKGEQLNGLF